MLTSEIISLHDEYFALCERIKALHNCTPAEIHFYAYENKGTTDERMYPIVNINDDDTLNKMWPAFFNLLTARKEQIVSLLAQENIIIDT